MAKSIQTTIAEARARAAAVAGELVNQLASFSDPVEALRQLSGAETRVVEARELLVELVESGAATDYDFKAYDRTRIRLWSTQLMLWHLFIRIFSALGLYDAIANLPVPQLLPEVPRIPRQRGVAGLGNPAAAPAAAAAGAAAVPAVVFWAAAILSILSGLAIIGAVAAIALAADEIAAIFVTEAQADQLRDFYLARVAAYRACLASGQTPAACAASADQVIPSPRTALPPREGANWGVYAAAGAGVLAALGLGVYAWRGSR